MSTYCAGTAVNTLHVFTYLIATVVGRYHYPHFIDEAKTERGIII